ncbi:MAG: hypothetical protein RL672_1186 [Actinomycetota bacterium]|jgi:uncharacterized membrane protein (DUF485 family)
MGSTEQNGVWESTQASPEFQALRRKFRNFAFPLTVAFLVWYFAYILLTAFARDWVSTQVAPNINIAFVLGILQFVSTFVIAWLYERHSTKHLDDASEAIKAKVEKELGH